MYEDFYHLTGRPFQLTPDPKFYFSAVSHKRAMAYLIYGLNQSEGFILITGDIGSGKTMLVRHLLAVIDRDSYDAVLLANAQVDGEGLLRLIADAYGLAIEGVDKALLLKQLEDRLLQDIARGRKPVLLVDEAQNLSLEALEELRLLSNWQKDGVALLQLILIGQPEFRQFIYGHPNLEQFRQRIIASHHLEPMQASELEAYLKHRLALVGWQGDPSFSSEAITLLYQASRGLPRLLNIICNRLMLMGAIEELHQFDEAIVAQVIDEWRRETTVNTEETVPVLTPLDYSEKDRLLALEAALEAQNEKLDRLMSKLT